jgi:hypothetical protein
MANGEIVHETKQYLRKNNPEMLKEYFFKELEKIGFTQRIDGVKLEKLQFNGDDCGLKYQILIHEADL